MPARTLTTVDDITVNDGYLRMQIVKTELKKGTGVVNKEFTTYHIQGGDNLGEFLIARRFKEFLLFREVLFSRYPGLYIPPMPSKQF